MSSLQESNTVITKRSLFRQSSFQKLKCTATYPLQLVTSSIYGSGWTKSSLTTVFETIIKKSREILQTAFLFLTTPVFEFLCATIVWLVDVFAKLSGFKITPFVEDVQKSNPIKVQTKRTTENDSRLNTANSESEKLERSPLRNRLKCTDDEIDLNLEKFFECRDDQPAKQIRLTENIKLFNNLSPMKLKLTSRNVIKPPSLFFTCFVHGSAIFTYLEVMFLAIALNTGKIPLGLLFLVFSLGFIGFIVFKIFSKEDLTERHFNEKKDNSKKVEELIKEEKNSDDSNNSDEKLPVRPRLSRSQTRTRYLDFNNRTVSKIKLL